MLLLLLVMMMVVMTVGKERDRKRAEMKGEILLGPETINENLRNIVISVLC